MNPEHEELDWLAFRYLADELPCAERAAFEHRLAIDQTAREAVARGVELTQSLAAAHDLEALLLEARVERSAVSVPAASARGAWSRPVVWMGVGAAACLAVVAAFSFFPVGDIRKASPSHRPDSLDLAEAWIDTRAEYGVHDESFWGSGVSRDVLHSAEATDSADGNDTSDDVSDMPMPSWMLSAIGGDSGDDANGANREN